VVGDDSEALPQILIVVGEDDARFATKCDRVIKRLGASSEHVEPKATSARAIATRPAALVLSTRRLADDAASYRQIAEQAGAALVTVDAEALEPGELELLLDATLSAAAAKAEAKLPPAIGPFRSKPE
jgi:hypothetical protein